MDVNEIDTADKKFLEQNNISPEEYTNSGNNKHPKDWNYADIFLYKQDLQSKKDEAHENALCKIDAEALNILRGLGVLPFEFKLYLMSKFGSKCKGATHIKNWTSDEVIKMKKFNHAYDQMDVDPPLRGSTPTPMDTDQQRMTPYTYTTLKTLGINPEYYKHYLEIKGITNTDLASLTLKQISDMKTYVGILVQQLQIDDSIGENETRVITPFKYSLPIKVDRYKAETLRAFGISGYPTKNFEHLQYEYTKGLNTPQSEAISSYIASSYDISEMMIRPVVGASTVHKYTMRRNRSFMTFPYGAFYLKIFSTRKWYYDT